MPEASGRHAAGKKLAYLSRHLARRERFDDKELGLQRLAVRSLLASLDEVEMHRIALKSRVRLEAPKSQALFSSQYLCGSSRPDTSHVIHEISIQDVQGSWTRVKALIDCGATSIFASPKLIEILGLQTQEAHTTTYAFDGNVMSHAKDSRKTRLSVSYFEHEQPVDESEVLIVPMTAYDLVLGLPRFKARNPEIDWEAGKLLSLQRRQPQPNSHGKEVSPTETGPDIQTLSATAFEDLCFSDEVSDTFSLTLGECTGLLGATTEGHKSELYTPGVDKAGRSSGSS
jgi:hypothetical protein